MLCFRLLGPGIITVRNMCGFFMHIQGERLYGVMVTSHDEYCWPEFPYGLKPIVHKPILTFLVSLENFGYVELKINQASTSYGWLLSPSSVKCSACYLMWLAVVTESYNEIVFLKPYYPFCFFLIKMYHIYDIDWYSHWFPNISCTCLNNNKSYA